MNTAAPSLPHEPASPPRTVTRMRAGTATPTRIRFLAGALAIVAASFLVTLGPASRLIDSDSLVPIFVSLEAWTPFYWGQDRFGMLIPWLAQPVRDSLWNLIVQGALSVAFLLAGTACVFARCGVRRPVTWALAFLALLLSIETGYLSLLLLTTNQSYGPALGLFGAAFYWCRPGARVPSVPAVVLMSLATWTNAGVALLVLAIGGCLLAVRAARPRAVPVLSGTVVALGAHRLIQAISPQPLVDVSHVRTVILADAPAQVAAFWAGAVRELGPVLWIAIALLWLAVLIPGRIRAVAVRERPWLLAAAAGSVLYGGAMAVLFDGQPRHATPVAAVLALAPLLLCARHLDRILPRIATGHALSFPAAGLAVAAAILLQTGVHTPAELRRHVITRVGGGHAVTLFARGVRVVTGEYWKVYPLVFATNLMHEAVGDGRPVLPVALRSEQLVDERRDQIRTGTAVAVVPSGDFFYWEHQTRLPPLGGEPIGYGDFTIWYALEPAEGKP